MAVFNSVFNNLYCSNKGRGLSIVLPKSFIAIIKTGIILTQKRLLIRSINVVVVLCFVL